MDAIILTSEPLVLALLQDNIFEFKENFSKLGFLRNV